MIGLSLTEDSSSRKNYPGYTFIHVGRSEYDKERSFQLKTYQTYGNNVRTGNLEITMDKPH